MAFDKNNTSLGMKIIIVGFCVVLVVSLCLPFFSGCSNGAAGGGETSDAPADSSTQTSAQTATVASVQEKYASLLDSLKGRLESDPDSLAYMANLGNNYMDCAVEMSAASDAADNEVLVQETFAAAVGYYDQYLEAAEGGDAATEADVNAVKVDRAVCLFYGGDEEQAVADLEAFVENAPDYAKAWYNLGTLYGQQGDNEKAREAFNMAIEKDPDNEAGVNSYAQYRLQLMDLIAELNEGLKAEGDESSAADGAASDDSASSDAAEGDGPASGADASDAPASSDGSAGAADGSSDEASKE